MTENQTRCSSTCCNCSLDVTATVIVSEDHGELECRAKGQYSTSGWRKQRSGGRVCSPTPGTVGRLFQVTRKGGKFPLRLSPPFTSKPLILPLQSIRGVQLIKCTPPASGLKTRFMPCTRALGNLHFVRIGNSIRTDRKCNTSQHKNSPLTPAFNKNTPVCGIRK